MLLAVLAVIAVGVGAADVALKATYSSGQANFLYNQTLGASDIVNWIVG